MASPLYTRDQDTVFDYASTDVRIRDGRSNSFESRRQARPRFSRNRRGPTQVNGIHRRRNKRFAW